MERCATCCRTPKSAHSVPEIQVTDGRIYLKTGDTKVGILHRGSGHYGHAGRDSLYVRFSGEPARTDRAARTPGCLPREELSPTAKSTSILELEKSPVNELGGLFRGQRLEYHGSSPRAPS